jgi:Initiation factor 2 subunit family
MKPSSLPIINFRIATFSRSSTILNILKRLLLLLLEKYPEKVYMDVICGRSTPGNEGEIMAHDIAAFCGSGGDGSNCQVMCLDDDELEQCLSMKHQDIDLFLIGSDCIMSDQIVNKVGTMRMAAAAKQQQKQKQQQQPGDRYDSRDDEHGGNDCLVYCCADRFKLWQDCFPPPLEEDIFECIPITPYFDRILIPPPLSTTC